MNNRWLKGLVIAFCSMLVLTSCSKMENNKTEQKIEQKSKNASDEDVTKEAIKNFIVTKDFEIMQTVKMDAELLGNSSASLLKVDIKVDKDENILLANEEKIDGESVLKEEFYLEKIADSYKKYNIQNNSKQEVSYNGEELDLLSGYKILFSNDNFYNSITDRTFTTENNNLIVKGQVVVNDILQKTLFNTNIFGVDESEVKKLFSTGSPIEIKINKDSGRVDSITIDLEKNIRNLIIEMSKKDPEMSNTAGVSEFIINAAKIDAKLVIERKEGNIEIPKI